MDPGDIQSKFHHVWGTHNTMSARMQELMTAVGIVSAGAASLCSKISDLLNNGSPSTNPTPPNGGYWATNRLGVCLGGSI